MTVRGARRSSTATGYLKRARARPNLRVLTGALVERIVIEAGRAASVRFRRGGRACHAVAWREVLLAGGDRTCVVSGKSVSVRVDLCGRRISRKKKIYLNLSK